MAIQMISSNAFLMAGLPRYARNNGMDAYFPAKRHQGAKVEIEVQPPDRRGASGMKITTTGINLAKEVFQIHGVDVHGKAVLRKQLCRCEIAKFFVNLEPCLIGMEACGSAHYLARNPYTHYSCSATISPEESLS